MTVYNTPGIGGQKNVCNGTAIMNDDTYVVAFGEHGQQIRSPNGGFTYGDMFQQARSVLFIQVAATEPVLPNGQLLPGALAALVLVGGGGAWLGYRWLKGGKK
ncbi:hypothetical protein SDC9_196151 [bioreactor metagenome]|uniref:Uncharacterized protein n=1 Tax=bioreactor metagenome TaxID=1076179 RepID=A0A645IB26_9ZZZZ